MVSIDEIISFVERSFQQKIGRSLSDLQLIILRESWQDRKTTYDKIAATHNYSNRYLKQVAGPSLWQLLSQVFEQKITKFNVRSVIEKEFQSRQAPSLSPPPARTSKPSTPGINLQGSAGIHSLQALESPLKLGSQFYIERFPDESKLCLNVLQSGALARIKGPKGTGKSSFLLRFLEVAKSNSYRTATLNFQSVDQEILGSISKLTRWTAATLSHQLEIKPDLNLIWDEDIGDKLSCTLYIESYLLKQVDAPVVIAFEELSELFQYEAVAQEFLTMLRVWHENTRAQPKWEKVHLAIVQATESYVPLSINQSPFTIGYELNLAPLNQAQVSALARAYGLKLSPDQIQQLLTYVNGHPRLIQLAFYHLSQAAPGSELGSESGLNTFLAQAATDAGIFRRHLHRHLKLLQTRESLGQAFQTVLSSDQAIAIPQAEAFKLASMGLVTRVDNLVLVSCPLYQYYFRDRTDL